MKLNRVRSCLALAACYSVYGCSEAVGDLVIENRSSRDIVIKFPHNGQFSRVVPAHSEATVIRDIQISGRSLYADVYDPKTKELLLEGPGDGEAAFGKSIRHSGDGCSRRRNRQRRPLPREGDR